ncbi:unnamed protein product [marine sediment metagenome]|uniref:Uncharacterized protein n=1 Tax=marine sediment metagenome TaxID=412755 RepID=X1I3E8_9ZZZZ
MSYDVTGKSAGDRLYGPHQSRYVTLPESQLVHPEHDADPALDFVEKGDPVLVNGETLIGVALKSAEADTDEITIDTEGIFVLMVNGSGEDIGNPIHINSSAGLTTSFGTAFGWALSALASGESLVAVKVHGGVK